MSDGRSAAPAHVDQGPDQRADHLVAEGVGLDLEGQQVAHHRGQRRAGRAVGRRRAPRSRPCGRPAAVRPAGSTGRPGPDGDRVGRRRARHPPAEGPEVVLAEQGVGGGGHGPQVERVGHVPGQAGQQRVGHRGVDHQVAVAAGGGRVAGVEARRGRPRPPRTTIARAQLAVAGLHHGGRVEARPSGRRAGRRGPPGRGRAPRRRCGRRRSGRPGCGPPGPGPRPGPRPRCPGPRWAAKPWKPAPS